MATYTIDDSESGDAETGEWTTTTEGIPVFVPFAWFGDSTEPMDPDGDAHLIKALVTKLDKAIDLGDRLAIAVIETTLGFGYADRFQREF